MKFLFVIALLLSAVACNRDSKPVANTEQPINAAQQSNDARSLLKHGNDPATPRPADDNTVKPARGGGDPIDTTVYDTAIAAAEKKLKEKSDDEAKENLAEAYFERGFALTEARQYAAALGDYRRALKYDPDHEESKKWIDQIVGIYSMMKREAPKEGAEPPPLPFKKS
jgi:tetratricopeptide (TPR) repeat protein